MEECEHEWETDDVWNPHTRITSTQRWCIYCEIEDDSESYYGD